MLPLEASHLSPYKAKVGPNQMNKLSLKSLHAQVQHKMQLNQWYAETIDSIPTNESNSTAVVISTKHRKQEGLKSDDDADHDSQG